MKLSLFMVIISIILIVTPTSTTSSINVRHVNDKRILENMENYESTQGTEYWALIVGVGEYYRHPDQNRPSMLHMVEILPQVLLDSPNWQSDHIHTLKGSQVTGENLIKELIWLIINEDEDDMSLVYITTHGGQLKDKKGRPVDLPPKDEADGTDEILVLYHGFERWYSFISDDILNFFLSLLESKGVCVIIDSCYSGGFNDEPLFITRTFERDLTQDFNAESFKQGFIEDVASQNRVVLMSCEEDSLSYGNIFSIYVTLGFWEDMADMYGNGDGINSAEESFSYADERVNGKQDPTILDLYPGEFLLTYTEDFFDKAQVLDIAVNSLEDSKVTVLLGDGSEGFGNYQDYAVGSLPAHIVAEDFNLDNIIDLATSNIEGYDVSVLLGDGYGGFGNRQDYAVGGQPFGIVTEDFNMDDIPDIATTNANVATISVLLGDGSGGFDNHQDYAVGSLPLNIVAGDFNEDGVLDLAVTNGEDKDISVLLGDGYGGFGNRHDYYVGYSPIDIVTDYFNNDDILDLAVSHIQGVTILLGDGSGGFYQSQFLHLDTEVAGVATGDIDKNGYIDLAVAGKYSNIVYTLFGDGSGEFGDLHEYLIGSSQSLEGVVLEDFDMDGFLDFAVASSKTFWITVFFGDGSGEFGNRHCYCVGRNPNYLVTGDFNNLVTYGPNLNCDGYLTWASIKPGGTVTGSFNVQNVGGSGSELNWEIEDWPDWGTWTFTPFNGYDLTPEDGPVIVDVEIIVPSEGNKIFSGSVKIVNTEDSSDFCLIHVYLKTSGNKAINTLFLRFLEHFPLLQKILGYIL
jgi:hypothetical protein